MDLKNGDDLNKIMLQSSIYVMTSYHESFGLVLIEAQSFGIPILAFDSADGPKEIIEDVKDGFLISNRDKVQMADKINELISNQALRKNIGQAGRMKAEEYKMENIEKRWFVFLEKI